MLQRPASVVLGLLYLLATASGAMAVENPVSIVVTLMKGSDGQLKCDNTPTFIPLPKGATDKNDQIIVQVLDQKGARASSGVKINAELRKAPQDTAWLTAELPVNRDGGVLYGDFQSGLLILEWSGTPCPQLNLQPPPAIFDHLTTRALVWLERHPDKRRSPTKRDGRTEFPVYHLPDGSFLSAPSRLSEEDYARLYVIRPTGALAEINVTDCPSVPDMRVQSSLTAAKDAVPVKPSTPTPAIVNFYPLSADFSEFVDNPLERLLRCGGTLKYTLTVTLPDDTKLSASREIVFDPIYHFSWGAAFVYDFGKPPELSLKERPTLAGTGTETFISRSRDTTGPVPMITLIYYPFGFNPKTGWALAHQLAPTIALDPTRIDEGFSVGNTFTSPKGFGLLVGVSVFKSDKLESGTNLSPGDAIQGPLPRRSVWSRDGLGIIIGANFSTDVFSAIFRK